MNDAVNRVEAVFAEALLQLTAAERAAFLDRACENDARLRARVEALLAAHADAGSFMSKPAVLPTVPDISGPDDAALVGARGHALAEGPGSVIGPYKLLQRIGEGGFGTVWMADQERPVRRRVALKIIKAGMDTKQVIARFEQERQALALMDHPNIARVLDAGATQTGRPYFVMELVRGVKITDYCDQQGLSTVERIKLLISVCHAVQHAHQKGVIHRDLKPSNILVTVNDGEAVPKVIDFGVAKATQGRLIDGTLFTQFEQMIGTPLYMSPEQAEITSLDVDTRSDVYSLGVLLYELLTGRTPIDDATLAKAGLDEVRRLIREVDPPRPSARLGTLGGAELTTVAKRRHTDASKLPGSLRGDLDWIVMKCLEKDRKRRYDTPGGLATDLQRHLRNEVVMARPPTTAYLLSKLLRRNKLAFAAGTAVATSLVVGIAGSAWQAVRATRAERRTAATLDELRAAAPAFAEQARALAAKERFDEAIQKLDYALKLRPPDTPELLIAKADLLQCQFRLADAAAVYREALAERPGSERARSSASLCDELLAAPPGADGKLTRESLAKLHLAMQRQQRPAAEMLPVARLFGEEKKLLVAYWLERLKDLPVSPKRPLAERLSIREDGRLALDLSGTKVVDFSPLAGAPLAALNLSGCAELTDLSPLRGLELVELNAAETAVADLGPLRGMHTLQKLTMPSSGVSDLSPLVELRLKSAEFDECPVRDLTPLRRMPLEHLSIAGTRVSDLSPLVGTPLKMLELSRTPVLDFSPLAALPLERCYLQQTRIGDLAVFRGRPLKELVLWGCTDARNYAVLSEIRTLELLCLPSEYRALPADDFAAIGALRKHPSLRQLGSDAPAMGYAVTGSKDVFWRDWDRERPFVQALRDGGIAFSVQKVSGETYHLTIDRQSLRDLSVLRGAPISSLYVRECPISDLSPLHELPLEALYLHEVDVTDLRPLRGTALRTLSLTCPNVTDVSPLKGLPLRDLYLDGCRKLTDLAPLLEIATLEKLTVPPNAANVELLRRLPGVQLLAFNRLGNPTRPASTVTEFWKDYDWISRLRKAGVELETLERLQDGTWRVGFPENSGIRDVEALRGAPISQLSIGKNPISDLGPLRGMRLTALIVYTTNVRDISALKGMPLEFLWLPVVDELSPLRGMPLKHVMLHNCPEGTDVSPLAECRELVEVTLPPGARNIDALRRLPKLDSIGFRAESSGRKTAANFWKDYDAWRPTSAPSISPAETLAVLAEQSAGKPEDTFLAMRVATLQAWLGKDAEYAAHCQRMLAWAATTDSAETANRVAKLACLRPDDDGHRREAALALAQKGVELGRGSPKAPWHQLALGMAEYRSGQYTAALDALASASRDASTVPGAGAVCLSCTADLYRAMSLFHQGKSAEAREAFAAGEAKMRPYPADERNPVADGPDQNDLIVWLAYKEAKILLAAPATASK